MYHNAADDHTTLSRQYAKAITVHTYPEQLSRFSQFSKLAQVEIVIPNHQQKRPAAPEPKHSSPWQRNLGMHTETGNAAWELLSISDTAISIDNMLYNSVTDRQVRSYTCTLYTFQPYPSHFHSPDQLQ